MNLNVQYLKIRQAYAETTPLPDDRGSLQVYQEYTEAMCARRRGQADAELAHLARTAALIIHQMDVITHAVVARLRRYTLEIMEKSERGIMPYELVGYQGATVEQVKAALEALTLAGKIERSGRSYKIRKQEVESDD